MIGARAAIAALAVAGVASAQATAGRTPSGLFRGWLLEQLDRDIDRARAEYEAVVNDDGAPREERAVARARLVELGQVLGRASDIERYWPDEGLRARPAPAPLQLPREAFQRALRLEPGPERDAELTRLREEVAHAFDQQRSTYRKTVSNLLAQLEKETTRSQQLYDLLQSAQERHDTTRIHELQQEIRRARGLGTAGESPSRATLSWRVFITRKLLAGQIEQAERSRRRLGLPPYARRLPRAGAEERFVRRLQEKLRGRIETAGIPQIEHDVLVTVDARLDELADEDRWRDAAELGAALPFQF